MKDTSTHNFRDQRIYVFALVASLMFLTACSKNTPNKKKPPQFQDSNIILITIDTIRADHFGVYGYSRETTPYMDNFAKTGVLFKNCYAQGSWTVPSMVSLFTSLSPLTHKIIHGIAKVSETASGKNDRSQELAVFYQEVLDPSYRTLTEVMAESGFKTAGFTTNGHLVKKQGFAQGFQYYNEDSCLWGRADCINQQVFPWLEENMNNKFFLWIHYFDPHADHGRDDRLYDPPGPYDEIFPWKGEQKGIEQSLALYDGEIRFTDDKVKELIDKVASLGLMSKSVVIITADHGDEFRDHNGWGHSKTVYNELIHAPLMIHFPGNKYAGTAVVTNVRSIDIMPTILDISGAELPQEAQGRSLLPAISGQEIAQLPAYSETRRWENIDKRTLIDGKLKLIADYRSGENELYDLTDDPGEKKNIYSAQPEKAAPIKRRLEEWIREKETLAKHSVTHFIEKDQERLQKLKDLGYLK